MGKNTKIEWTHGVRPDGTIIPGYSYNPWWGCVKSSPGCKECYAETMASRTGWDIWGKDKPRRLFGDKHWREPLNWNTEALEMNEVRRVFCASMADVFEAHESLEYERLKLWPLVDQTEHLDWLFLTKYPGNIESMIPAMWWKWGCPENVWMGVSAENQEYANRRIPILLDVPARIRFVSAEPLLGPISLSEWFDGSLLPSVEWVIVGGESGPNARPMDLAWARDIVRQCREALVPVFVKQMGTVWARENNSADYKGGIVSEWPEDLRIREFPNGRLPPEFD